MWSDYDDHVLTKDLKRKCSLPLSFIFLCIDCWKCWFNPFKEARMALAILRLRWSLASSCDRGVKRSLLRATLLFRELWWNDGERIALEMLDFLWLFSWHHLDMHYLHTHRSPYYSHQKAISFDRGDHHRQSTSKQHIMFIPALTRSLLKKTIKPIRPRAAHLSTYSVSIVPGSRLYLTRMW